MAAPMQYHQPAPMAYAAPAQAVHTMPAPMQYHQPPPMQYAAPATTYAAPNFPRAVSMYAAPAATTYAAPNLPPRAASMYVGSAAAPSYAAPAPTYAPQAFAAPAPMQVLAPSARMQSYAPQGPFAQTHTAMPTHYEDAPTQGQYGEVDHYPVDQGLYGGFGQMESAHLDRPSGVSFPTFY